MVWYAMLCYTGVHLYAIVIASAVSTSIAVAVAVPTATTCMYVWQAVHLKMLAAAGPKQLRSQPKLRSHCWHEVAEVPFHEVDVENCKVLMEVIQHAEMTGMAVASAGLRKIVKDLILGLSATGEQRLHFRAALQTLSQLVRVTATRHCCRALALSPLIGVPGVARDVDDFGLGFDHDNVHWETYEHPEATYRTGDPHDEAVTERCQRNVFELLSSPFTMVDIGAGLGIWSMTAAENNGTVHAFEPNPFTYEVLLLHLEQNRLAPQVIANQMGVSNHSELSRMYINSAHNMSTVISTDVIEAEGVDPSESFPVQFTSIDDYFISQDVKTVDLIRIDESLSRLEILHGARNTLKEYRPLVYIPHAGDISGVNKWMASMDYAAVSPCNIQLRPDGASSPENLSWDGKDFRSLSSEGKWDGFWLFLPNRRSYSFSRLNRRGARESGMALIHGPFSEARISINGQSILSNFSSRSFSFAIPHRFTGLVKSLTVTVYLSGRVLSNRTERVISCTSDMSPELSSYEQAEGIMPRLSPHSRIHELATHLLTVGHVPEKLNIAILVFGLFRTVRSCLHVQTDQSMHLYAVATEPQEQSEGSPLLRHD